VKLTVANYASGFDEFDGQRFEFIGEESSLRDTQIIKTRLIKGDGEVIQLDYRLRPIGSGWQIIDVFLDGTISELALRRSQYAGLVRREGFAALIDALDEKIASLRSG
jgi:phospholipid transport system substrate-binding protein